MNISLRIVKIFEKLGNWIWLIIGILLVISILLMVRSSPKGMEWSNIASSPGIIFACVVGILTFITVIFSALQIQEAWSRTTDFKDLMVRITHLILEADKKYYSIKMMVATPAIGNISLVKEKTIKIESGQASWNYESEYSAFDSALRGVNQETKLEILCYQDEELKKFYQTYQGDTYKKEVVTKACSDASDLIDSIKAISTHNVYRLETLPYYHLIFSEKLGKCILFIPLIIPALSTPEQRVKVLAYETIDPLMLSHLKTIYEYYKPGKK